MRTRNVVVVAYPGMQSLDAVGPYEVFAGATRVVGASPASGYTVRLVSVDGRPVRAGSGMVLGAEPLPAPEERIDTLVLPGGDQARTARSDRTLMPWIAATAPRCRRVATVCTGAFLAAEAGLLDGRRVTTHWASAGQLAREYPRLEVDADPIYLRDGKYWTSAGVTAGIDLALALVEDDLGAEVAQTVARWLVMFLHRPGGQTQFASPVWVPAGRALRRAGRTDPGGVGPGGRPPAAGPGRGGGHERAPLHPGVHRRGGGDARSVRRAGAPRGGPSSSWRPPRTPSRSSPPGAASARPRPCGGPSSAVSASRPTPTDVAFDRRHREDDPHERRPAGRHPPVPPLHRPRRHRALRGAAADPHHRRHLHRTRAGRGAQRQRACSGITVDATFEECPEPDVVVFPGGVGTRALRARRARTRLGPPRPCDLPHDHLGLHRLAGAGRRRPARRAHRHHPLVQLRRAGRPRGHAHAPTGWSSTSTAASSPRPACRAASTWPCDWWSSSSTAPRPRPPS